MAEQQQSLFRKKTLDRISSPEQLTDYLCVTSPGIWIILATVVFLMAGILAWSAIGTLETKAPVKVVVEDHNARIIPKESTAITEGMTLRIVKEEYTVAGAEQDEYGRNTGIAEVNLPDGSYDGDIIVDRTHPLDFLTESR